MTTPLSAVRSTMSQEAVQEFQINRSNFAAEFGRAAGGMINIVSKSGTNEFGGNVFAFLRDQSLDARNPFAFGPTVRRSTRRSHASKRASRWADRSGAIKTFFFLSYEGLRQRESRFVTFLETRRFFQPTPSQSALIAGLNASPSANLRALGAGLAGALTTSTQTFPDTVRLLRIQQRRVSFSEQRQYGVASAGSFVVRFRPDVRPAVVHGYRHVGRGIWRIERAVAQRELRRFRTTRRFWRHALLLVHAWSTSSDFSSRIVTTRRFRPILLDLRSTSMESRFSDAISSCLRPETEKRFQFVDNFTLCPADMT